MTEEYITKEKKMELEQELEQLTTVARKEIAEKLEFARDLGDLSENAEYHNARDEQAELESKIEQVENILRIAKIIPNRKSSTSTVMIGSKVTIQKSGSNTKVEYVIVGSAEADMHAKKISHESPLGQALLGKKTAETITIKTPNGIVKYSIKKLE
jgi:transcription elongation factor GreA